MDKDNNNKKIILNCMRLLDTGHDLEYCLHKYPNHQDQIRKYFGLISSLGNLKKVKPAAAFKANLLNKIYENVREEEYRPKTMTRLLKPAVIFISVFLLFIFSSAGVLYASQASLPGQPLYSVKRSAEDLELFFYPSYREGRLHFKFLNKRLIEARALLESKTPEKENISYLLDEIMKEYRNCRQHNYFGGYGEEQIVQDIDEIYNRYQKRFGQKKARF
ncbi:MAG: DUF5667 domain-containing protein [Candidatus Humimicrobiaceae bacterium]